MVGNEITTGHHRVVLDLANAAHVAAPETVVPVPTAQLLSRYYPKSLVTEPLEGFAVPVSTRLNRELLGFVPTQTWRQP